MISDQFPALWGVTENSGSQEFSAGPVPAPGLQVQFITVPVAELNLVLLGSVSVCLH